MSQIIMPKDPPLFVGADWNFSSLKTVYDAIEKVAIGEMGLDVYPNQIEVITSDRAAACRSTSRRPASAPR